MPCKDLLLLAIGRGQGKHKYPDVQSLRVAVVLVTRWLCEQVMQEMQAKALITLDRCYFADLFALFFQNLLACTLHDQGC